MYARTRKNFVNLILKDPEIVFLTAFRTPNFLSYLKQFSVSECYEKPIELGQLVAILKRVEKSHGHLEEQN